MSEKVIVNTINEKITSWLDRNRDAFGRKILCSGIDVRTAVHISHLFPDSSIVLLTDDPAEEKEGAVKDETINNGQEETKEDTSAGFDPEENIEGDVYGPPVF